MDNKTKTDFTIKASRARPGVDILIPFHGKYEYVTRCTESILRCTPNQKFNIYLIDDCSPNKSFLRSMITKRISGGQLDEQVGFGAALYQGYLETTQPWLVIMHSDCVVTNVHWLLNMQHTMHRLKGSGVKLVSARTDNAGTAASYHQSFLTETEGVIEDVVVDSPLPLTCALMHRDLFKRINGFIKPYPFAWFEDEELYWRMHHYGYKQAICGSSFVHHEGGATIRDLWSKQPKSKQVMESNYDLCIEDIKDFTTVH